MPPRQTKPGHRPEVPQGHEESLFIPEDDAAVVVDLPLTAAVRPRNNPHFPPTGKITEVQTPRVIETPGSRLRGEVSRAPRDVLKDPLKASEMRMPVPRNYNQGELQQGEYNIDPTIPHNLADTDAPEAIGLLRARAEALRRQRSSQEVSEAAASYRLADVSLDEDSDAGAGGSSDDDDDMTPVEGTAPLPALIMNRPGLYQDNE